ncbi:hypothetical protein CU037_0361 [Enterococcus faecium]|nr:hypothetical protein [Enterococcus faecium]
MSYEIESMKSQKIKKFTLLFRRGLNTYTSARILAGLGIKAILIEE